MKARFFYDKEGNKYYLDGDILSSYQFYKTSENAEMSGGRRIFKPHQWHIDESEGKGYILKNDENEGIIREIIIFSEERLKKIRRQIEDRLRKDTHFLLEIAKKYPSYFA